MIGTFKTLKIADLGWIILYLLRFYLNVFSPLSWPICSSEEFWFAWFILISYTIQPSVTENMKRLVCFSSGGMKGLPIILCFELYYRSGLLTWPFISIAFQSAPCAHSTDPVWYIFTVSTSQLRNLPQWLVLLVWKSVVCLGTSVLQAIWP